MDPSVVSEVSWDMVGNNAHQFNAYRALTNTDKSNYHANWVGRNNQTAYFVYNVGCKTSLNKLELRNSCNGVSKDRLGFLVLYW